MKVEDRYWLALGKIVSCLHTLEILLRGALTTLEDNEALDFFNLKEGYEVGANSLTDFRSLPQLIDAYNHQIANGDAQLSINRDIVKLRNALAHGRVAAKERTSYNMLVKFGPEHDGIVTVEFAEIMTFKWMTRKREMLESAIKKVSAFLESKGLLES